MSNDRLVLGLLVPLSIAYLLIGFDHRLLTYDEGLCVYGAARVLGGDVVYRDFWSLYGPAQFYVLAGLYKLFGASLIVGRLYHVIVSCVLATVVAAIATRLCSRVAAVIAWCVTLIWIDAFRFPASPLVPALLFGMLSTFSLLRFLQSAANRDLVVAGALVGAATLFRHDIGALFLISEWLVLVAFVAFDADRKLRKEPWLAVTRVTGYYMLGTGVALAPASSYFVSVVPAHDLVNDLIVFPLTVFPDVRSLPWPLPAPNPAAVLGGDMSPVAYVKSTVVRLPFYFPLAVYAAAVAVMITDYRSGRRDGQTIANARHHKKTLWGVMLMLVVGITLVNQAAIRSHLSHLLPTMLPAGVLVAWLVDRARASNGRLRRRVAAVVLLLALGSLVFPLWNKAKLAGQVALRSSCFTFHLPRAHGIYWKRDGGAYQKAIQFVQHQVPVGERIFVGNARHDRIFTNDVLFYFLADRHSATKYHELHPGLATTKSVQEEIIADIERHDVRCIVLLDQDVNEPNASAESSGVTILDRYIRQRYVHEKQFGEYGVWLRRR